MQAAKWNHDGERAVTIELDEFELWRDRGDQAPLIIRGEARIPQKAGGTVVICHGFKGFARFSFFPHVAEKLAEAGYRAITFDFSGSGVGDDRESFTNREAFTHNTYLQELDDLDAVVGEGRVRGWIDGGYGLFGHSRGGGIAILQTVRDSRVKALVTWAAISSTNRWPPETVADWRQRGFIDIANARTGDVIPLSIELLHEVEEFGETKLNIAVSASQITAPWLIVHGAEDETVPVSEGQRLANLAGSNAELRVIDGVNHSFGGKHPLEEITPTLESVTRLTVEFFTQHLGDRKV
ncbi:MAG TPA: alpha/beta fold hydrolase [Gemmatimonadaceae bacterium]